jgi:hypothetical protein
VQPARSELKFVIDAGQREQVLAACREVLAPDPHAQGGSYRVTSQYYDAPDLRWYWEKVDGVGIRRKVRLRAYGEAATPAALAEAPRFLEVKHRRGDKILKERVRLTAAASLLEDPRGLRELAPHLADGEGLAHPATVTRIEGDAARLDLERSAIVTYRREPYVGLHEGSLRLTFDHDVQALPPGGFLRAPGGEGVDLLPAGQCVLELKFNARLPGWARQAFVAARLRPRRFSKYATGVEALGLQQPR